MPDDRTLARHGGTHATGYNGRVRLELWLEDRAPQEGPLVVWMSPGQAIGAVEQLAGAARQALVENIKGYPSRRCVPAFT